MKRKLFSFFIAALCCVSTWALDQDTDGYYLLGSVQDWQEFVALGNSTANAKMIADIDLGDDQTKFGGYSSGTGFAGTFDGQGHTLTLHYVDNDPSSPGCAPFGRASSGAVFKNLHIAGSITTAGMRPASITSRGSCYIQNCWSSVAISSSRGADIDAGGFVGRVGQDDNIYIEDCIFTGSIEYTDPNASEVGGFIGWTVQYSHQYLDHCLFAPSNLAFSTNNAYSGMLVGTNDVRGYIKNSYYNSVGNAASILTPQGTYATDEQLADGTITAALQANREEEIWVQDPVTNQPMLKIFASEVPEEPEEGLAQDEDGYYLLGSAQDLKDFAALVNAGSVNINARMTADIDLEGSVSNQWTPIGNSTYKYNGVFDGQGHVVKNLYYKYAGIPCVGFIGVGSSGAYIKNLRVEGYVDSSTDGYGSGSGEAHTCAGGIMGGSEEATIINCSFSGSVISYSGVAGIVGCNTALIINCYNEGEVIFHATSGQGGSGIHGTYDGYHHQQVINSYNVGSVINKGYSTSYMGSISCSGTITNCYSRENCCQNGSGASWTNIGNYGTPMSLDDMQTEAFVATLNENVAALKATYPDICEWVLDPVTNLPKQAIFASEITPVEPTGWENGVLPGKFTINANGDQVVFSQGNLQYKDGTGWRFAEHQWDFVGAWETNDWVDLFGWGTGNNPTLSSWNYSDYSMFTDWGTNAISDGGNVANEWYSLSEEEWTYLFNTRENAGNLRGHSTINGVNGYVLLPDDFIIPDGLSFTPVVGWGSNVYSEQQWTQMEAAGAVFFPAAGSRAAGASIGSVGEFGGYYTCTNVNDNNVYNMSFGTSWAGPDGVDTRCYGRSVRLVQAVPDESEPEEPEDGLTRDTEHYYILNSVQDWQDFATLVQTIPDANARMVADINLGDDQTMIGTLAVPYEGIFDGQGHTLTVAYSQSGIKDGIGPFYVLGAATIKNLHVDGSMLTRCAIGGIVGIVKGNAIIQRCWASATLQSNGSSPKGTIGGICSVLEGVDDAHLIIEDCLFDGTIVDNEFCGGFMSHVERASCSVTMRRGLNVGTYPTTTNENGTFIREVLGGARNLEASTLFHKKVFGRAQGTQVTDEQLANGSITTALQAGREETVWVQDAVSGQPRLDIFNHPVTTYDPYVYPTSQVIDLSLLTEDYIAQDGDILTGITGYGIKIAADATITLSDVMISTYRKAPMECLGNATIIIEDGSTNKLKECDEDTYYARPGLAIGPAGTTLTINGNTGKLIAIGGKRAPGIGCEATGGAYGSMVINGGIITATGGQYAGGIGSVDEEENHGPSCGDITINGGTITAGGGSWAAGIGAVGRSTCGTITINGGTINVASGWGSVAIGGNTSQIMIHGGDIHVSSYRSAPGISCSGVVCIDGGTVVASGSDGNAGINGDKGVVIRSGITSVRAIKDNDAANAIQGATVYISANLNDEIEGNTRTLTPKETIDPEAELAQDEEGYYLIGNAQNWKEFAVLASVETAPKAKLIADVDLGDEQAMVGSFDGLFDGQGHTLTVNLTSTANVCGVFRYVADGAIIQNLRIAGTINGAHRWIGGFVGEGTGTYSINNCISSVTINTTYSGDGVQGGFVAAQRGTLYMNDCIFDGVLNGPNAYTWGGFVGWYYGGSTLTNCLVLCDEYTVSMTDVATFIAMSGTLNNCYYKTAIGTAQGTQATANQLADGTIAFKLQDKRADLVWGQRIGIDAEPVLTNDENYRVYKSKNGGYTNNPEEAYEGLQQDEEGNYLLGSLMDWKEFAELVQTTPTANAKMIADIDLGDDQTMIGVGASTLDNNGSGYIKYQGTFDGQGHTLTIHYVAEDHVTAPFRFIQEATIKNLRVDGDITTTLRNAAGIVGICFGPNMHSYIENCTSSVNIISSYVNNGDFYDGAWHGGIAARLHYYSQMHITDCVFNGSISGENKSVVWGGMVGIPDGTVTFTNCLQAGTFDCSDVMGGDNGSGTMATVFSNGLASHININSCYYRNALGNVQGTQATAEQLADGSIAYLLQGKRTDLVWGQRIGIDAEPVLTNDESYRVYIHKSGSGYTNDPEEAYKGLQQDEDGNYLLGILLDWQTFAELVQTTPNANAKMIADIDLGDDQTMIGSNNTYPYSGIFDGQGHTLTVAYNNNDAGLYVAPFSYIYGATIRNMHIAGTIQTACQNAGVVSKYAGSGNVMENVWCSLAITTNWTVNGGIWECCSGLVGSTLAGSYARLTMNDCLFTGSVVATSGHSSGCFVGYIDMGCSANISNCLSLGTYSYTATNSSVDKYSMSIANSYIKQFPNDIPAAMQITDEQIASGVIAYKLQNNRADLVWGQRIGVDPEPVLTNDESYRVYISKNGGYTNDPDEAMPQDEEGYFLLGSVQDWQAFAALINSGMTTANARMTADIDLGDDQTMIGLGSEDGRYGDGNLLYTGIFDGQGHTLTINYVANERFVAPFRHIQDATIKNLRVAGTITTSEQFTGGMVGACYGQNRDNYITNCISSVNIVSSWVNTDDSYLGGSLIGGIIGKLCYYNRLHISDCIFNGSISGENRTVAWGGFVGLPDGTIIVRNSLLTAEFNCTNVMVGYNGSGTFSSVFGGGYASSIDIDGSNYYLNALGAVQGTQANVNQLADGTTTTALQAGREEEIWVQNGEMPMLKLFASEITPVEPTGWENGVLPGKFSVNANGDQVFFSQGNLQYQASTATWRFANNQYYFVGAGNANTSDTYDGWIDLFGWATNGLEANTATGKMPYYTGSNDVDYGPSIPSGEFDRSIYDWGTVVDGDWQTLSNEEWNYLFVGRANSNSLYGFGRLYGINGVIILPDDWDWNEAEIAAAVEAAGFTWSGGAKTYSGNIISNKALWSTMESAGAVFLPAAGYRKGTINMAGNGGDYWSATASSATNAYRTSFSDGNLALSNNWGRSDGLAVRLVQAVPPVCDIPLTEIDEIACDSFQWAGTTYYATEDITKTFEAVNGCDSVVTLHLIVNHSSFGEESQTAEGSYEWIDGKTYTESGDYTYTLTNVAGCDSVVTLHLTITNTPPPTVWENGVLPGKFSINADGDQVFFSQGNLQYQASTDTWRFAIYQYDMIGGDNTYISDSYDGWIDLIQWGAGNNPTTTATYTYNTFVEFGTHPISNGGEETDVWRTMTKDEWVYIFCGRTNAESLFGLGAVNGVNGLIILPDNWTTPDDLTFNPSTEHGLAWQTSTGYYKSSTADGFSHNVYTSEQWATMESNGAVFLPAAGIRYIGTKSIQQLGTGGYYWSSVNSSSTHAYIAGFGADVLNPQHSGMQDYGHSIRLVQAVPTPGPATGMDELTGYGLPVTEKVLRNNQILILRGDKIYTIDGQEVR